MIKRFWLGSLGGLELSADTTAIVGFIITFVFFMFALNQWTDLSSRNVLITSVLATFMHFFLEYLHQYGHSIAARMLGYPMKGVHFFLMIGASVYPSDESELTPSQHIKRALGGPIFSALIGIIVGLIMLSLRPLETVSDYLLFIIAVDSIVFFCLGALTPLPLIETDGRTILKWLKR